MNTADRLKLVRKKLKLTQESLAFSIGLNRDKITSLESGKVKISTLHALALEYVHGVNKDWLLNGEDPIFKDELSENEGVKPVPMDPAVQILHEALEETGVEINEKQKQACLKILREELAKSDTETKEDIKKYLRAFWEL